MQRDDDGLTVVVPSKDRAELLDGCLDAIYASIRPIDEVIVVDSASADTRTRDVALAHGARYIRCDVPGTSLARNTGWKSAKHDVVTFVDDDVRVTPGWTAAVARAFDAFPDAAFLAGQIGIPPGEAPEEPLALMVYENPFWIDRTTLEDPGHSANLAVRRAELERVGGFDESLGGGARYHAGEDKDLLDRLLAAGSRGRHEPSADAVHLPWRDRRDIIATYWGYGIGTGARIAKLLKTDRARLPRVVHETFWEWGVKEMGIQLWRRYRFRFLAAVVRTAAMCVGFVRAIFNRVEDGHFVTHSKR